MENLSNIAANRIVTMRNYNERKNNIINKKQTISKHIESARYRRTTFSDAYNQYNKLNDITESTSFRHFSFGTFYKYVDKRFKKPFRCTDLCHYCEFGKDILKEIKSFSPCYDFNQEFNSENLFN